MFVYRGREASPFDPPERLTVRDAFRRYASIDIYDSLPIIGVPTRKRSLDRQRMLVFASHQTTTGRTYSAVSSVSGSNQI